MPEAPFASNTSFEWSQPEAFRRAHLLTANGLNVGSLNFEKGSGSLATAACAGDAWSFKRVGFLSPRVSIRKAGSDSDLAVFTPTWSSGGTVEFAGGRRFGLRCLSFWGCDWAFEDEQGQPVVTLHGPKGFLKSGGESRVTDVGAGLQETPLLLMLLWYVRLLANEDMAATTAVMACCG